MRSRADRRDGELCRRRQSTPRNVLSRVCTSGSGMPLGDPMSTLEYPRPWCRWSTRTRVPRRAVRTLGGRSARAPPSAAAGWPRLPRPAKPETGYPKLQRPASGPTGTVWRRRGSGENDRGDGRVRRASGNSERVGTGRQARGAGWEGSGRLRAGVRRAGVCRRAQCSPPCVAAFDTAVRWARPGNDATSSSPWLVCTRVRLSGCTRVPPVRPLRPTE